MKVTFIARWSSRGVAFCYWRWCFYWTMIARQPILCCVSMLCCLSLAFRLVLRSDWRTRRCFTVCVTSGKRTWTRWSVSPCWWRVVPASSDVFCSSPASSLALLLERASQSPSQLHNYAYALVTDQHHNLHNNRHNPIQFICDTNRYINIKCQQGTTMQTVKTSNANDNKIIIKMSQVMTNYNDNENKIFTKVIAVNEMNSWAKSANCITVKC